MKRVVFRLDPSRCMVPPLWRDVGSLQLERFVMINVVETKAGCAVGFSIEDNNDPLEQRALMSSTKNALELPEARQIYPRIGRDLSSLLGVHCSAHF